MAPFRLLVVARRLAPALILVLTSGCSNRTHVNVPVERMQYERPLVTIELPPTELMPLATDEAVVTAPTIRRSSDVLFIVPIQGNTSTLDPFAIHILTLDRRNSGVASLAREKGASKSVRFKSASIITFAETGEFRLQVLARVRTDIRTGKEKVSVQKNPNRVVCAEYRLVVQE